MRDLRFLSASDLDKFLVNLRQQNEQISALPDLNRWQEETLKNNGLLIAAVEAELVERLVLQHIDEDGSSE